MGRRASGRLFEEARIALKEEDVVKKVEAEWAKVEKGGEQSPVLLSVSPDGCSWCAQAIPDS